MNNFSQTAEDLFMQGYSCSESVVKAAYKVGIIDKNVDPELLNKIISPFSGAMGTHQCLCGAVAGSQLVLGLLFGRTSPSDDPNQIKKMANDFYEQFKTKRKSTCCRALSAGFKETPLEQRKNCAGIVKDATTILENILERVEVKV